MRYPVRVRESKIGGFVATCLTLPGVAAKGASRREALEKVKAEIRYYIETCPCGSVPEGYVQIEVVE